MSHVFIMYMPQLELVEYFICRRKSLWGENPAIALRSDEPTALGTNNDSVLHACC